MFMRTPRGSNAPAIQRYRDATPAPIQLPRLLSQARLCVGSFTTTRTNLILGAKLASAIAALSIVEAALAGNPRVQPPQSHAYGKTRSEWVASYWQWLLSIPADSNSLLDETGEFCDVGQSGKVWFLAGVTGSGAVSVTRSCSVPAGKAVFFPIINTLWISTPGDPGVDEIREIIGRITDHATDLSCEIDGRLVQNIQQYRVASTVFAVDLPDNNIFGVAPGEYGPNVDDGFYLLLPPLPVGPHTIHFHGSLPALNSTLNVTYNLTVTP